MFRLYVRLVMAYIVLQLGVSAYEVVTSPNRQNLSLVDRAVQEILDIEWRPISAFPNQAQRYHSIKVK